MRVSWRGYALVAACVCLWGCDVPAPEGDPLAAAQRICADERAETAARIGACGEIADAPAAEPAARAAALAQRGELRRIAGEPTAALRDFSAALALEADNAAAKLGRADVLIASGQLDAAMPLVDAVLAAPNPPARAHALRGDLLARYGDRTGALAEYDAALARGPRDPRVQAARGLLKQQAGDFDGARVDLDAALSQAPDNAPARAGRCWNRMERRADLPDARRDAEAAIAADPTLTAAHLCLGLILLRQEQWQAARETYDAALVLEPANAAALFGRGFARRELGERREGAADIRRAYDFNSEIDETFERLGVDF